MNTQLRTYAIGLLLCCNTFLAVSWQRQDITKPLAKKQTTFLVYIAGDNNLWKFIESDIQEMQQVGSNENLNILVYNNTKYPYEEKVTQQLVVHKGYTTQDGPNMRKDSGDKQTVIDACAWAHAKFPADRFVIVFWNHGSGSINRNEQRSKTTLFGKPWGVTDERAVCYDDTTGSFLTDGDLRYALNYVRQNFRNGNKIDIVAFDACLMADIEVAYAIEPYARFMVASQQTIPGEGYGYSEALDLAAQGITDTRELVADMVDAYQSTYQNETQDYTLSGIDLGKLPALVRNVNYVSRLLVRLLNSSDREAMIRVLWFSTSEGYCTRFEERSYIDLGHFYANVLENLDKVDMENRFIKRILSLLLRVGLYRISHCVLENVAGRIFPEATGLSIYFDQYGIDPDYATTFWAHETNWYDVLDAYNH